MSKKKKHGLEVEADSPGRGEMLSLCSQEHFCSSLPCTVLLLNTHILQGEWGPSGQNRRFVFQTGHKGPGSYPTDYHSGSLSKTLSPRMLPGRRTTAAHCSL
ncbi:hypothetical protein AMECASPLE_023140 [Ameca splendens]|uniref:Uncharacterized protein n=1 Tax=Ameca splendens TaxID=208324 RepID=A0ABV0YQY0_9TELE